MKSDIVASCFVDCAQKMARPFYREARYVTLLGKPKLITFPDGI
jgi:hypothetical protein